MLKIMLSEQSEEKFTRKKLSARLQISCYAFVIDATMHPQLLIGNRLVPLVSRGQILRSSPNCMFGSLKTNLGPKNFE